MSHAFLVSHADLKVWKGCQFFHPASLLLSHFEAILAGKCFLCANGSTLSLRPGSSSFLVWENVSISHILLSLRLPFHLSSTSCCTYTPFLKPPSLSFYLCLCLSPRPSGYIRKSPVSLPPHRFPSSLFVIITLIFALSFTLTFAFLFPSPLLLFSFTISFH